MHVGVRFSIEVSSDDAQVPASLLHSDFEQWRSLLTFGFSKPIELRMFFIALSQRLQGNHQLSA